MDNFVSFGKVSNLVLGAKSKKNFNDVRKAEIGGNTVWKKYKGILSIKKLCKPKNMSIIVTYFETLLHSERHHIPSLSISVLRRHLYHYAAKIPETQCIAVRVIHLPLVNYYNKVGYYDDWISSSRKGNGY